VSLFRFGVFRLKVSFAMIAVAREIGVSIIETGRNFVANIIFSIREKCARVVLRFKRIFDSLDAGSYPECIRKVVNN
jgi:hypothetical protein